MSTAIISATTDNRQSWDAKVAEARTPFSKSSPRYSQLVQRLVVDGQSRPEQAARLLIDIATMSDAGRGEVYDDYFGPHLAVWDNLGPAWADVRESSIGLSTTEDGFPTTTWSSHNLAGRNDVDAFLIRDDVYNIDTATVIEGTELVRVYIGDHDPIEFPNYSQIPPTTETLNSVVQKVRDILDPRSAGTDPDDMYDENFVKFEGLTSDEAWARGEEILASPYAGAIAMRVDGGCQDTPANLYHQITVLETEKFRISLVKDFEKPWRIDSMIDDQGQVDAPITVNDYSLYADYLHDAAKRAGALNAVAGFTAEENLA